jgi:hypothetical protein
MKWPRALTLVSWLPAAALLIGCGHHEDHDHHAHEHAEATETGHDHEAWASSGASYQSDRGILLTEETRRNLGIEVTDVTDRHVPNQIPFTVQVFGEKHLHRLDPDDHTGCDVHGSAFLPDQAAAIVTTGQSVEVLKQDHPPLGGVVLSVHKALALGESEVVIGVSNATAFLGPGEFVPARIRLSRPEAVPAIPQSALLRTSEGAFVYAVNGNAYRRTPVQVGAEADGWAEITDGVAAGDQIVTRPVQTLWLIELRATKGGGHVH